MKKWLTKESLRGVLKIIYAPIAFLITGWLSILILSWLGGLMSQGLVSGLQYLILIFPIVGVCAWFSMWFLVGLMSGSWSWNLVDSAEILDEEEEDAARTEAKNKTI